MDIHGQLSFFTSLFIPQKKTLKNNNDKSNDKSPQKTQIIIDGIVIDVVRKKIKNINITVYHRDGRVRIATPMRASEKVIKNFALTKLDWIKKHRQSFESREYIAPIKYQSGETHYYNGKPHSFNVIKHMTGKPFVELKDGQINLYLKGRRTFKYREKVMREWYRAELKRVAPPLIKKWESHIGVQIESFGIRQMKSRWGTCNTTDKRIWLNLELAKKSTEILEYIIVHELTHLMEASHNKRFKKLMDKHMPNWRTYSDELKQG